MVDPEPEHTSDPRDKDKTCTAVYYATFFGRRCTMKALTIFCAGAQPGRDQGARRRSLRSTAKAVTHAAYQATAVTMQSQCLCSTHCSTQLTPALSHLPIEEKETSALQNTVRMPSEVIRMVTNEASPVAGSTRLLNSQYVSQLLSAGNGGLERVGVSRGSFYDKCAKMTHNTNSIGTRSVYGSVHLLRCVRVPTVRKSRV